MGKISSHIYLGELEKAILRDLALNPDSLIQPIKKRLKKDYKNVHNAIENLVRKECVKPGRVIKSQKGKPTQAYKLTDLGILYVFLDNNIDYNKIEKNYHDDSFIIEYRKILRAVSNNRRLVKRLVRKAAQLALDQDNREELNSNPDALLCMSLDSVRFYSKLQSDEKASVEELADKCVKTIQGNRRFRRAYREIAKGITELKGNKVKKSEKV